LATEAILMLREKIKGKERKAYRVNGVAVLL